MSTASAIAPLMIARFRRLWSANLLANIGAMAQAVTAAWLMTEMTAGDPTLVAAVQTCASLPLVLLSLPGGALADLFTPRRVMLAAQVLVLCAGVALLALAASGRIGPAALLGCVFASGAGFALANPAWHASIRDQTGDDRLLEPAVLLNAVGFNLARSLGPATGGWLIALAGPLVALTASAAAVVPLIAALWAWRPTIARPMQREPLTTAIHAGIRYVRWRPSLTALILRACFFTFSGASIWALAPLVAHQRLSGGAAMLGTLVAMFGLGAFAGALVRARFVHWRRATFLSACTLLYALATILLGLAQSPAPAMLAMVLAGGAWVAGLSGLNVAIQVHAARWVAARAIALLQAALFLGLASGSLIWGVLADQFGLASALVLSGTSMLATLALGGWLPIVSNDAVDLSPAPASNAMLVQRHTYRPHAARQAEFQQRMRQLERARRRDGASHWSLKRMADGGWIEEFAFRHADDARRYAARRTREDERLEQDIAELLEGHDE